MKGLPFKLVTEPRPSKCGAKRGPRSKTHCELPPDHCAHLRPHHFRNHLGRSPSGKWFAWPMEDERE